LATKIIAGITGRVQNRRWSSVYFAAEREWLQGDRLTKAEAHVTVVW
jgi:hypothetical protein